MAFKDFPPTELWRLIIDGYLQTLGPYCFDNPRGNATEDFFSGEPNYLDSMLKAFHYLNQQVEQRKKKPLTIDFIEQLYQRVVNNVLDNAQIDVETNEIPNLIPEDIRTFGHSYSVSITLSTEKNGNATLEGIIELLKFLNFLPEWRNYFDFEIYIDSTPHYFDTKVLSHQNMSVFIQNPGVKVRWICKPINKETVKEILLTQISLLNKEILKTKTEDDKLRAIVKFCHHFEILHPFPDGNCRTCILLLNYLLMQNNLDPVILNNPNCFDGFSIEELVLEVKKGQNEYQKYQISSIIKLIGLIQPDKFITLNFISDLKRNLSNDSHIKLAQLNYLYELIMNNSVGIASAPSGFFLFFNNHNHTTLREEIRNKMLAAISEMFNKEYESANLSEPIKAHVDKYFLAEEARRKGISEGSKEGAKLDI